MKMYYVHDYTAQTLDSTFLTQVRTEMYLIKCLGVWFTSILIRSMNEYVVSLDTSLDIFLHMECM